jgi:hypothetical protein
MGRRITGDIEKGGDGNSVKDLSEIRVQREEMIFRFWNGDCGMGSSNF